MNFFNYFIKCIIRKFVNILFNPKKLLILCLIVFLLSFFYGYNQAFATDVTNDVIYVDVINVDNIQNLENVENIETLVSTGDYLNVELAKSKTSQLKFIQLMTKYYQQNGRFPDIFDTYMRQFFINNYLFMFTTNQTEYTTVATSRTALYVFYTNSSNVTGDIHDEEFIFNNSTGEVKYSLPCQDYTGNLYNYIYNYPNEVQESFIGGHTVSIPSGVEGYYCSELINFFYSVDNGDFYGKNTESYLNDINNSINETNNFLQNDTVPESSINIESDYANFSQETTYNNFLTSLMNRVKDTISVSASADAPIEIAIPFPFTDKYIYLYSDMISKYVGNTQLGFYIRIFWIALLGWHLFMVGYRIMSYFTEGEFLEKGIHPLIKNLNEQNAIIKPFMM